MDCWYFRNRCSGAPRERTVVTQLRGLCDGMGAAKSLVIFTEMSQSPLAQGISHRFALIEEILGFVYLLTGFFGRRGDLEVADSDTPVRALKQPVTDIAVG